MEKQYQPSKKRRLKARQEGNVPKSQYLSQTVGPVTGLLICLIYLRNSWVEQRLLIEYVWTQGFKAPFEVINLVASKYFFLTLKLLLIVSIVSLLVEAAQVGLHLEPGLLALKLDRINPAAGVKKAFGNIKRSWLVVLRFCIVFFALGWFFYGLLNNLGGIVSLSFDSLSAVLYKLMLKLCAVLGSLLIGLALFDYYLQRRKWFNTVGMTLEEMKREHKEDEGDPHIKSVRKQQHRELLQQDLIKRIRAARVIIVEKAG